MKYFILIGTQFLLILFLFLSGPIFISFFPFNLIQIFSIFFICWALLERVLHRKQEHSKSAYIYFLKTGPYEFIRHPIYAGILLFASSAAQGEFTFLRFLDFLLFLFLIILKIKRDEQLTLAHFKHEYSEYSKNTKQLIPYAY